MLYKFLKTNHFILNHPVLKVLVYANVFIALCSVAQVLANYKLFHIPFNYANSSYVVFVLLSTFLQYNVQRGYMIDATNINTERSQWIILHKKTLMISIGVCLITVLFLCNNLSWLSIGIMVGAEVLSTLYYLPAINLRKQGYIKPFLVSFVWVISCSAVPLIENHLISSSTIYFLISQFFFIGMLCVLFDVKDAETDYLQGINTYANKFGFLFTKLLAIALIALQLGFLYLSGFLFLHLLPILLLSALSVMVILLCSDKKHAFFYYLIVDGLLLVQYVLFLL